MGWGSFVSHLKAAVKKAGAPLKHAADQHRALAKKAAEAPHAVKRNAPVQFAHLHFNKARNILAQTLTHAAEANHRAMLFAGSAPTRLPRFVSPSAFKKPLAKFPGLIATHVPVIPGKTGMAHAHVIGKENRFAPAVEGKAHETPFHLHRGGR